MGGSISVFSKKNEGTTVTVHMHFEITSDERKKEVNVQSMEAEDTILNGKKILLAEDHPLNAEIARKLLEKKGMFVTCASDGALAVNIFEHSLPNYFSAILMDVRMPKLNGLEATETIRKLEREDAKSIPIIAMTANAYESDRQACKDAGMNMHLAKPVNPKLLYSVLAEQIEKNK